MLDSKQYSPIRHEGRRPWMNKYLYTSILCSGAVLLFLARQLESVPWASGAVPHSRCRTSTQKPWQWSDITPSSELDWQPCYEEYQCARLDLPVDWLQPSSDKRVALAVIRLRATETDDYRGPVFVNPGGPGGSGIHFMKSNGKSLQTVVGRNYDIISFDPRGIGESTPGIQCFSSPQNEQLWDLQEVGVLDSHPGVFHDAYARALAHSAACLATMGGVNAEGDNSEAGMASFVSTTSVARDLLELMHKSGQEKLNYWGFSYGTMLGGMFATMYPDKVGHLINDGNVDYAEWSVGAHRTFVTDTDKIMDGFYKYCHLAGPLNCDMYDESPEAIKERLQRLFQRLKLRPIVVPAVADSIDPPEIVSYSAVKRLINSDLYQPFKRFPGLATIFATLEAGDGAPFVKQITEQGIRKSFSCGQCSLDSEGKPIIEPAIEEKTFNIDAFASVMCSDGGLMNDTMEEFEQYANHLQDLSKEAGAVNIYFRISCVGWKAKAKWRYPGPFEANTSNPILFIGNTADNVTPLQDAFNNAKGFNGSAVLVQESYGHTTLSAPSVCTASHIRAYFQDGVLPKTGTKCKADVTLFQPAENNTEVLNVEERELSNALWDLTRSVKWGPFPGL